MQLQDRRVMVTVGAGFIGSHLVDQLLELNCDVVVADDFSRGSLENIEHCLDDVELVPADLTTREGCLNATVDVDDVFHLAASVGGIHYIQRENVGGLTPSVLMNHHMLEAARTTDVERFLFASSACIYRQEHDDLNRFSEEQAMPADPHSTYGWAKVLGEVACQAYNEDCDLDTAMIRIFNCYGPRESLDPDSSHVNPLALSEGYRGDRWRLDNTVRRRHTRGFIYLDDLVEGMIRAIEHKCDGEPINLGNGEEVVTINELVETIIGISGKDIEIEHDLSKPTGTDKYAADTERMELTLDWKPGTFLEDGVREVYEWAESELAAETDTAVEGYS